jgi:hypothetical protein
MACCAGACSSISYTHSFEAQREVPFLIAQVPYDPSCPEHFLALQTIYKLLTGNSIDCAPTGTHWDVIGFQGLDPCTDLNRSMGMLSILQVCNEYAYDEFIHFWLGTEVVRALEVVCYPAASELSPIRE